MPPPLSAPLGPTAHWSELTSSFKTLPPLPSLGKNLLPSMMVRPHPVCIHAEVSGTRTCDGDALVHEQFAAGQDNGLAVESRSEINEITVVRICERLTQ
ncbi:MAG: hypothetical protein DME99_10490 [Verrucomicrobia bacterium]|nr:MAG: hypothetical protein DME99_10490 [Verrucomicrobiota bacterium]